MGQLKKITAANKGIATIGLTEQASAAGTKPGNIIMQTSKRIKTQKEVKIEVLKIIRNPADGTLFPNVGNTLPLVAIAKPHLR